MDSGLPKLSRSTSPKATEETRAAPLEELKKARRSVLSVRVAEHRLNVHRDLIRQSMPDEYG